VAVNSFGDVVDPATGETVAGTHSPDGQWIDTTVQLIEWGIRPQFGNTTLAVVATDAQLTQARCNAVANMAQAGLARAIRPAFTLSDGDTIFALSTGDKPADPSSVGVAAAEAVAQAIVRAVKAAETLHGIPAHRDAVT
jgi:L-aminopeptidase/D-esterase-like protein